MFKNKVSLGVFVLTCLSLLSVLHAQYTCTNPNNNEGTCVSLYDCPALLQVIRKVPLLNDDRLFLAKSQCSNGHGRSPYVCCTDDIGYTATIIPQNKPTIPTAKPSITQSVSNGLGNVLPSPPKCGNSPLGNRIYNGNDTAIDEFPWMVLLEYLPQDGKRILNCGGSLINQRYVLTAAHCVTGAILKEAGQLVTVRLGEFRISTDIDCVDKEMKDCNEPIVEMDVEESTFHPQYTESSPSRHYDIGLVRMNGDVKYTDFIRPVCMPWTMDLPTARNGENFVVSGWGRTLLARQSDVKQKLYIPVADQNECATKFSKRKVNILPTQLCAGGRFSEDSCDGDSGGPLMREKNSIWALVGIVSFGNRCGLEGWPGVYTKVSEYEDWIKNTIKP